MNEYIGVKKFCQFCKHSEQNNKGIVCKNKESSFYNCITNNVICAPCIEKKKLEEGTKVEYIGFDD